MWVMGCLQRGRKQTAARVKGVCLSVGSATHVTLTQGYPVAGVRETGALGREGDVSITAASGLLGFSWSDCSFRNFLIIESVKLTQGLDLNLI